MADLLKFGPLLRADHTGCVLRPLKLKEDALHTAPKGKIGPARIVRECVTGNDSRDPFVSWKPARQVERIGTLCEPREWKSVTVEDPNLPSFAWSRTGPEFDV